MNVLVACEESQAVTIELRKLGIEAYSCDVEPCSGGHPEWHIKGDVVKVLTNTDWGYGGKKAINFETQDGTFRILGKNNWDMIVAFPPCTYMTNASAVRMRVKGEIQKERYEKMLEAKTFFYALYLNSCEKIVIENPVPLKLCKLPPYSQIIQPWQHGHPYSKRTCLWIKGLPLLAPTQIITEYEPYINGGHKDAHGNYRRFKGRNERDSKTRSKTFPGIARAMAEQWGMILKQEKVI